MTVSGKVFFPGLNGLRFFAAAAVVITHIELLSATFGYKDCWTHPVIFNLGGLGVCFFFVLSGFLITFLLLKEKEVYKKVSIRKFYVRRILRIWPLYFLVMLIGFFLLPQFNVLDISYLKDNFRDHFWENFFLYLFIMPNLAYSLYNAVPHIGQLWSIGVEEQFYLFWPWLIKFSNKIVRNILLIISFLLMVKVIILFAPASVVNSHYYKPIKMFFAMSKIESMAIGALGAYFLFHEKKVLRFVYSRYSQILLYASLPLLIYFTPSYLQDGVHVIYSLIFIGLILNISSNSDSFIKLNNKIFDSLGNISYGIYMYHMMLIPIVLYMVPLVYDNNDYLFKLLVYILTFSTTLFISYVSYAYFEKYFVKLKSRFAKVASGTM